MFTIDTSTTRWRRVATTGLALPMALMLSGTALAAGPSTDLQLDSASAESSSTAKMTIDVDCFTVAVTSDKDISNVKVTFADGSFQEIEHISGYSFNRTFAKAIASATSKSATTTVSDSAGSCTAPVEEQPPVEDETPVEETPVEETPAEEAPVEEAPIEDDKATQGNGTANISIEVDCRTIRVVPDKDISNVKATFADGSFQEIEHLSGYTFNRTFAKDIASATSKSATTTVADDAGNCSAPVEETPAEETPAEETPVEETPVDETPAEEAPEDEAPVCPTNPVRGPVMEGCESPEEDTAPGNGTANISIEVDCYTVRVKSDKDISNVKVTFADGEFREINGLSGYTFERTFTKEIASATAKSATTMVADDAGSCSTPVEETPVCPTEPVMGPVMEGCETDEAPVDETPAEETPAEETPAEEAPVQAPVQQAPVQETPAEEVPVEESPVDNTPIGGQPAPQPATGGETPAEETPAEETPAEEAPGQENTPISGQPAPAPATGVVNNGAVAPVVVTTAPAKVDATPTALPFTGANAELLAGLGSLLLLVGGGAAVAGRRERVAQTA